jgi:uncharacterized membrane protein
MGRQHPLASPQVRRSLVLALVLGALGVGVFVLGPTGHLPSEVVMQTHEALARLGLPSWLSAPPLWGFVYNVALFVPVAFVCATLWRGVPVWGWTGLGLLGSLAIEGVQALFLEGRSPEIRDLVANTLGALVGALLARMAWQLFHRAGPG